MHLSIPKKHRCYRQFTWFFLWFSFYTHAATIVVDGSDGTFDDTDGVCSLSEAILAANTDTATNECVAGSGDDIIELSQNITLMTAFENDITYGSTGTPAIDSNIVLEGNGFRLLRDNSLGCDLGSTDYTNKFRLLRIANAADLEVNNIILANGCVHALPNITTNSGGAIYNDGVLSLANSTLDNNAAWIHGGGIYNSSNGVISSISRCTFSYNSAIYRGGGVHNAGVITSVENSTFSGNSVELEGGAIYNRDQNTDFAEINNSTFSTNSAITGGAVYFEGSQDDVLFTRLLFHNNMALNFPDCKISVSGGNAFFNMADNANSCAGQLSTLLTPETVAPLADYGCNTPNADGSCIKTHALLSGSEALDMASNGFSADQRGFATNGVRDIGAFEAQPLDLLCWNGMRIDGFDVNVNDAQSLIQAMQCATLNGDANGGDTINLAADITLNDFFECSGTKGCTATPPISTPVVLNGDGYILQRDEGLTCDLNDSLDTGEFRLLRVTDTGDLTLNNMTLAHGCADGADPSDFKRGGAIYNDGTLAISSSTVVNSSAQLNGGGIYNFGTINGITNSTFSNNFSNSFGAAIFNHNQIGTIENNTFSGNASNQAGSAISNFTGTISALNNSLFHFNSGSDCHAVTGTFSGHNNMSTQAGNGCPGMLATQLLSVSLAPLADNGCLVPNADGYCTLTHALLPGTEAQDAAVGGTATDQRGYGAEGIRDIGAFELLCESCPLDLIFQDGFEG